MSGRVPGGGAGNFRFTGFQERIEPVNAEEFWSGAGVRVLGLIRLAHSRLVAVHFGGLPRLRAFPAASASRQAIAPLKRSRPAFSSLMIRLGPSYAAFSKRATIRAATRTLAGCSFPVDSTLYGAILRSFAAAKVLN